MKQGKNFPALLIHKCILPPPSGHSSQFLLVPGGLLMCWVAKKVVDGNLQER